MSNVPTSPDFDLLTKTSFTVAALGCLVVAWSASTVPAALAPTVASLPGALSRSVELQQRLDDALANKGPQYTPRTKHQTQGVPKFNNRLLLEKSPYLQQHAHNPVDWFPWGEEAFALARELNRPVFLSVGYSTCHWCHVMEEESFEDVTIARYLNEHFIAIKVDREERPDVDAVYMAAVQSLTGRGGWPMSVWLTPDKKPFFGGTYYPPYTSGGRQRIGFFELLEKLNTRFHDEGADIENTSQKILAAVEKQLVSQPPPLAFDADAALSTAVEGYARSFDEELGGVRVRTKFPSQLPVRALLRIARRNTAQRRPKQAEQAQHMATFTLEKMAMGGMHDHLGGGFHRYSTDRKWLVPHFEKMLYDNALLALDYLEGWQVTSSPMFERVVRDTLTYVERDMTADNGLFFSATDADSIGPHGEREEGYYFTWTPSELAAALGDDRARLTARYFGVTERGNFTDRGRPTGRTVLHQRKPHDDLARELTMDPAALRTEIDGAKAQLKKVRDRRDPPLLDDKVLTSWNGLMISAFATAGRVLGDAHAVDVARKAADVLWATRQNDGRLWHAHTVDASGQTSSRLPALLDDYAFFTAALLDVFEATGDPKYLQGAYDLAAVVEADFLDKEHGAYFTTAQHGERLLVREKPANDGAEPTGNSVHTLNLVRLARFGVDDKWRRLAVRNVETFGATLQRFPRVMAHMLLVLDALLEPSLEVVVVSPDSVDDTEMRRALGKVHAPNASFVFAKASDVDRLGALVPWVKAKAPRDGQVTAYVCEQQVCRLPTTDPAKAASHLSVVKTVAETMTSAE